MQIVDKVIVITAQQMIMVVKTQQVIGGVPRRIGVGPRLVATAIASRVVTARSIIYIIVVVILLEMVMIIVQPHLHIIVQHLVTICRTDSIPHFITDGHGS